MLNLKKEISRKPPDGVGLRIYKEGKPILYAFDCALLERDIGDYFVYTAVNLISGKTKVLSRRYNPLAPYEVEKIALRMRQSSVAGAGRLQVDRPVGERISLVKAREILRAVFKEILPQHGFTVRKEQLDLAEHILNEIARHGATLAEAEVGTGKTLAYLVAAIIAKRGRLNDSYNKGLYPKMQYAETSQMPIVIATSSIALQRAIMTEYIPELSRILLESGIIMTPLTAVLRKGKEHYVCERNLRAHLTFENNAAARCELERLLPPSGTIDLAEVDLTPHIKRKISVSGRCFDSCPCRGTCQYTVFREQAQSPEIDIQVCNHNYLLADTLLRDNRQQPLIPNYQTLIVDEAHKFLQAARTMYGVELSSSSAPDVLAAIDRMTFRREDYQKTSRTAAKKLHNESVKLFSGLTDNIKQDDTEDDTDRFNAEIGTEAGRCLRNIRDIANRLMFILRDEAFYAKATELLVWVQKKYGINPTRINLQKILANTADVGGTRETQRELMHSQSIKLHRAICDLPEIKQKMEVERFHRQGQRQASATERQAIRRDVTVVSDVIWEKVRCLLPVESATSKSSERMARLIWDTERLRDQATALAKHSELICWLEADADENRLCAIPKDLDKRLFDQQWSKGVSTILTSGTLSAGGDFTHVKRTLGLGWLGNRVTETSKPSPFNYQDNTLLYISETMPFPDRHNKAYIAHTADEIEKLVRASHGHAAVLFTSYKVMDMVWETIEKRGLPFPLFRLDKGGVREIERFKQSNGGVLFASGALWEGIDIPGDALSLLIIVKLPFAVPDPISKYEQSLYKDMSEYIARVVVPEMLIKLKQGFGRLIRMETDTGVVAILDSRVNSKGAYRARSLAALPNCRVTDSVEDVSIFIKLKKPLEYFKNLLKRPFSKLGKRGVFLLNRKRGQPRD